MKRPEPDLDPVDSTESSVRVSRRVALQGGAAAATALLIGAARANADDPAGPDPFEALSKRWLELAAEVTADADAALEERYLRRLGDLIAELPPEQLPRRERVVFDRDGMKTGPAWASGTTFLVELTLDPGAVIQAHDHPGFAVTTAVIEGEALCRQFEPDGDAPTSESREVFRLREMSRSVLVPGRRSDLSRSRDNIHWFRAGEAGATLLDFTYRIGGTTRKFSALDLSDEPIAPARGIFEARWIGNPYK